MPICFSCCLELKCSQTVYRNHHNNHLTYFQLYRHTVNTNNSKTASSVTAAGFNEDGMFDKTSSGSSCAAWWQLCIVAAACQRSDHGRKVSVEMRGLWQDRWQLLPSTLLENRKHMWKTFGWRLTPIAEINFYQIKNVYSSKSLIPMFHSWNPRVCKENWEFFLPENIEKKNIPFLYSLRYYSTSS